MQNVHVKRYKSTNPLTPDAWLGWIEPEDRSWLLFINAEGYPVLMLRKKVQQFPESTEETYVHACAVFDTEGVEVKQTTLRQLGLRVLGFELKGPFLEEELANPPRGVTKAKELLDKALEDPSTRWSKPYQARLIESEATEPPSPPDQ